MNFCANQIVITQKKRLQFHIVRETQELTKIMPDLPENEVYKMISCGGFSGIAFVKYIAEKTRINRLIASSLRIGKRHLMVLDNLYKQGKLDRADFVVGSIMKNDSDTGKSYGYYDSLVSVCEANNWRVFLFNNHSKILLFDTDLGKFVLETSSNLNENPNMEHFSFEKNTELYAAYENVFESLFERSVADGKDDSKKNQRVVDGAATLQECGHRCSDGQS